jgi:hypothetical protein
MYWGTCLNRITTASSVSLLDDLRNSQWYGQLSAVHYAIMMQSVSFATREHLKNQWIRNNAWISQTMTAMAGLIESIAPLCCLLCGKHRHWPALVLAKLHLGLLITFRLTLRK